MNNTSSSEPHRTNEEITGSTIVAIISIVLAACWIAFAYYKGSSAKDADGGAILLLHPIVAILLIFLLSCIRHLIAVKGVVTILIAMISIWLFTNMLGVLMPFIIGFGFAYFFRFLVNAMQDIPLPRGKRLRLRRGYARAIVTIITLGVFALLFLYILPQIGKQSRDMTKGLINFYHQTVVPFAVGNKFHGIAIHPNNPDVIYLATAHGIYLFEYGKVDSMEDMTGGDLIGKSIQAVAAARGRRYQLYVGTNQGLFALSAADQQEKGARIWRQIGGDFFEGQSIQVIGIPPGNSSQLYVGTDIGLYRSDNEGVTWREFALEDLRPSPESAIRSIAFSVLAGEIYLAWDEAVYRSADLETWSPMELDGLEDASIQAFAIANFNGSEQFYAGTSKGLYQWQRGRGWKAVDASVESIPALSLLTPLPKEEFYAGNDTALYRLTDIHTEWKLVTYADGGLLSTLKSYKPIRDLEIVSRVEAYLTDTLPTLARTGSEFVGTLLKSFSSIAIGFGGFLATTFLALMVFIYASQSFRNYIQSFINLFPQHNRDNIRRYLVEVDRNLESFLRGQVTVILIISIISIIVYSIIGVPFALVVGLLAGICNAIPTFGPYVGGLFALL
ncbi:MAG: AI-2E family transporter, partial [Candidatus Poribacteria bacterium]|nr:AI-2E family transporter [Candidatus Poribacteria bacterium]